MRKETDLRQVKETAHAMLMSDIQETEFSPVIVKHPFTDSGIMTASNKAGGFLVSNLIEDTEAQKRWRAFVGNAIDKAKSAYEIYMMVTKPYGLTFLKFAVPHLSKEDMSNILASTWTRTETPNQDVNVSRARVLSMFKTADPQVLMEQDDYIWFRTLDDELTIYRGVTSYNAGSVKALSWTLSRETAEWFAHRFGEEGIVYEARIAKEHVYAFLM